MSQPTKQELLQKLEDSRIKFLRSIQDLDINKIIYADGGWRARDIMLNVAYWEYEGAKSLNAFSDNSEYFIPNFFEISNDINKLTFEKYKEQDYSELQSYFDAGRVELIAALQKFKDEDLSKELMAFYGGKATIFQFIEDLISHEQKHLDDIVNANSDK